MPTQSSRDPGRRPNGSPKPLLTSPVGNYKIAKNETPTWSLSLQPARSSGIANLCTNSTRQCREFCLVGAGRNPMASDARQWRTELYVNHREEFIERLRAELKKLPPGSGVRLNALSDVRWEREAALSIGEDFQHLKFYDYTKHLGRVTPPNYKLTFSISERQSIFEAFEMAASARMRLAVVAALSSSAWQFVGKEQFGVTFIDGDLTDWRFDDPPSSIVLLRPKGPARKAQPSQRGFVKP